MQKQLVRIMNLRYWKSLVGLLVIIVGLFSIAGVRDVNAWQTSYKYNHSKAFIELYQEHPEYYGARRYDETENKSKALKAYQNDANQFFKPLPIIGFGIPSAMSAIIMFVVYLAGMLTFANDRRTHFDTFLLSLSELRRRIYWTKLGYGIGTLLGSLILGQATYYLIVELGVKAPYAQLNLTNLSQHAIGNIILMLAVYVIGVIVGLVIGELPTLLIGGSVFIWLVGATFSTIGDTQRFLVSDNLRTYATAISQANGTLLSRLFAIDNNQALYKNPQQVGLIVGILVAAGLLVWCGQWLYRQVSLDRKYELVQVACLKKPIMVIGTLYLAWMCGMNSVFSRSPLTLVDHQQKWLMGWILLRNIVVIGIFAWLFVERPWQKQTFFKRFRK